MSGTIPESRPESSLAAQWSQNRIHKVDPHMQKCWMSDGARQSFLLLELWRSPVSPSLYDPVLDSRLMRMVVAHDRGRLVSILHPAVTADHYLASAAIHNPRFSI
jgi:hypothetical protein